MIEGIVVSTTSDPGTLAVYDGCNTAGAKLFGLTIAAKTTHSIMFPKPIPVDTGIYADVDAATTTYTILWEPRMLLKAKE